MISSLPGGEAGQGLGTEARDLVDRPLRLGRQLRELGVLRFEAGDCGVARVGESRQDAPRGAGADAHAATVGVEVRLGAHHGAQDAAFTGPAGLPTAVNAHRPA
jgi:hypothetical protein